MQYAGRFFTNAFKKQGLRITTIVVFIVAFCKVCDISDKHDGINNLTEVQCDIHI